MASKTLRPKDVAAKDVAAKDVAAKDVAAKDVAAKFMAGGQLVLRHHVVAAALDCLDFLDFSRRCLILIESGKIVTAIGGCRWYG